MSILKWVSYTFLAICIAKLSLINCSTGFSSDPHNQQQLDRVSNLPGLDFNVSFAHYSGYVTVNKASGRSLFYWFFEADEDPSSKPLVLWLNGGPGCSSIAFGLAEEIGPFHVEKDGKTLYSNPYSWNKAANILFLDFPVGVGFSYSNTSNDLMSNGDKRTAADNLKFLQKWFERFPQYKGREFYITGESYAGHYVPQLSQAIVRLNKKNGKEIINLKGFMVGNALTDDFHDHLGVFQFMWSVGMISDQTFKQLNVLCDFQSFIHISDKCKKALDNADEEIGDIDLYSIFTPPCTTNFSSLNHPWRKKTKVGLLRRAYDPCTEQHSKVYFNLPEVQEALHVLSKNSPLKWETCNHSVLQERLLSHCNHHHHGSRIPQKVGLLRRAYDPCTEQHSEVYFNLPEVQEALHVLSKNSPLKWDTCNDMVNENWNDSPRSVLSVYRELLHTGLRIWIFSGDTDAVIPVTSTRYSIDALKLPTVSPWRPWYDDGQVGGWTQEYDGLTFVTVRGAGHEVPLHKPKQALTLIESYLSGRSMPKLELVSDS